LEEGEKMNQSQDAVALGPFEDQAEEPSRVRRGMKRTDRRETSKSSL
jgi:hypothetical protein